MNNLIPGSKPGPRASYPLLSSLALLLLFFTSCNALREAYTLLEFRGIENVNNFTKSFYLVSTRSDSLQPAALLGSNGDLFTCDEAVFVWNGDMATTKFSFNRDDNLVFVNGKIFLIELPDSGIMNSWSAYPEEWDLSNLQFISINSQSPGNFLPFLQSVVKDKPDVGFLYSGNLSDLSGILQVFNPRYLIGPTLNPDDYGILSGMTNLEIQMTTPGDTIFSEPLPAIPSLKQIILSDVERNVSLTNEFLANNRQIQKVVINKSGTFDLAILNPLEKLKELLVFGPDVILHGDLINNHQKLEVVSVTGVERVVDPGQIRLPALRWISVDGKVVQEEFDAFISSNPRLEVIEIIDNDTVSSFQRLATLENLRGLIITDSVTDIETIKTLTNLEYLSLPDTYLQENKAEIENALSGTRIVANQGFCLGSGWLLLIIPLIIIIRFLDQIQRNRIHKRKFSGL